MISVSTFLQLIVWGVIVGCVYALASSGFSLIFGVTKRINLAHGELIMVSGYTVYWLTTLYPQLNPYFLMPLSIGVAAALSAVYYVFFSRIAGAEKIREAFLAIGLVYIIENTAVLMWREDTRIILSPYRMESLKLGAFNIGLDQLFIAAVTAIIFTIFYYIIAKSKLGKELRAVSQNREAALLIGLNVNKLDAIAFILSGVLAGLGGTLLGIVLYLNPYIGMNLAILAFIIVVFGGMGSLFGAVLGALIISTVQRTVIFFLGGEWSNMVAFIILVFIMILRPQGLFGKEVRE